MTRFVVPMVFSKTSQFATMKFDANDPEDAAFLEGEIEKAKAPLIAKRDELMKELKTARKSGGDPAALERMQTQLDEATTALETANASLSKVTKERDKSVKLHSDESAFSQKLLIDNGLSGALTEAKIAPQFMKAVMAVLAPQAKIHADGTNRVVKIGDKTLTEYVKEWSQSDEGKHFTAAPVNAGSNANGGSASASGKSLTRAAFETLAPAAKMEHSKAGGTVTD